MSDPLDLFHPLVGDWFRRRFGTPTPVQAAAWPVIAEGRHVLATAPTGSGKTLAAFLFGLDRLLSGAWEGGRVRILYVSPLKALNNDVERNLLGPLAELEERFRSAGEALPQVKVATRSGDTPTRDRQRMVRHPPEILITTPESLNLLLTSAGGRSLLTGVRTLILDEVHAVAASKRGTHLFTAVERLTLLAGEVQRVALSATVRPLERVARLVGGYELQRVEDGEAIYRPRPVTILDCPSPKSYDLTVELAAPLVSPALGPARESPAVGEVLPAVFEERFWPALVERLSGHVQKNRTTLLFTNSRRMAEKVTRLINGDGAIVAYSHHGSLARDIRQEVERRFKEGELPAIVATSSLELGIDIGDLDEVLLLQTPPSVASTLQRIGRAGHSVGAVSRGRFYPTHGRDLLDAAVVARQALRGEIEPLVPIEGALDVLAQVILSMVATERWLIDDLFDVLRASEPYHRLPRHHFDLTLDMLVGRYADTRIRELAPRVVIDRLDGTVEGRRGTARLVYLSGGTIPDRGYYQLRLAGSMAKLGELDEEFVWERSIGDSFTLGAQTWRIEKITHNDVLVAPGRGAAALAPFWRADEGDRNAVLAEAIGSFLETAEQEIAGKGELADWLAEQCPLSPAAARELSAFLVAQRSHTGAPLPHRHHLVAERVRDPQRPSGEAQLILHTGWGGKVNRPFALALAAAWEERHATTISTLHDNDAVLVVTPEEVPVDELLSLLDATRIELLLSRNLEQTGFFGGRFREAAGRALLLPRGDQRHRVPLWLNRQRSKKLLEAVRRHRDFPLAIETWRSCLSEELDLPVLRARLEELAAGQLRVSEVVTHGPSPFAAGLAWKRTNTEMYEDDAAERSGSAPALGDELLRELVVSGALRRAIPPALCETLRRKLQRTADGYAPPPGELVSFVAERLALSEVEWTELRDAVLRDHPDEPLAEGLVERLVRLQLPGVETPLVAAIETVPRLLSALGLALEAVSLTALGGIGVPPPRRSLDAVTRWLEEEDEGDPAALLGDWLAFHPPLPVATAQAHFGWSGEQWTEITAELVADRRVVVDPITQASFDEVADAENLERLLRMARAAARPAFTPLPLDQLPLFLAVQQGLAVRRDGVEGLEATLDGLFGYAAPAALWEEELLPSRLDPYYPAWLDSLLAENDVLWRGCGRERLTFQFADDLELLGAPGDSAQGDQNHQTSALAALFPPGPGRYTLGELAAHTGRATGDLTDELWSLAWDGQVTNDTFAAVRNGLANGFVAAETTAGWTGARRRGQRTRWQASRAFAGRWLPLAPGAGEELDPLDRLELDKDRLRLLLERYGVLFRELLLREEPSLSWASLFRSLRLMELSGEVLGGRFFDDVPGVQFASPKTLRRLREGLPRDVVYWMSALDPASPAGLPLAALRGHLPRRAAGNQLVFHGDRLVLSIEARGRRLDFSVAPDHPRLLDYLAPLVVALTRAVSPRRSIDVETVNGEPAGKSPFAPPLAERFVATAGPADALRLWRRF